MSKINLYVSCHKNFYVPENNLIKPVQVGASLTDKRFGIQTDNTGENISDKNARYCELTAQYWAWKNDDADYYGFFHYRRYFIFNEQIVKTKKTYKEIHYGNMNNDVLNKIGLEENNMRNIIEKYDIIVPTAVDINYDYSLAKKDRTVYGQYKYSDQHDISDLDKTIEIIHKLYPHFDKYVKKCIFGKKAYLLNMYIMKKKYFNDYCNWLYPILDEFDKSKDYSDSSIFEIRTPGLIAERILGVYLEYIKDTDKNVKIKELDSAFFENCDNPYPYPAFKENNISVCFACDNNYAPFAGVVLSSIIKNSVSTKNYDVLILDNGISENNKYLMNKTISGKTNISLRFLEGNGYLQGKKLYEKQHINKSSYLRFALVDILKNYNKTIYLDCDVVVNHDIAELFDIDLEGKAMGVVKDSTMASWNKMKFENGEKQRKYNKEILGIENLYEYFNTGVILMDVEKMREVASSAELFKLAEEREWTWQDQDILNKVYYGKTKFLDLSWNFMAHTSLVFPQMLEFSAPKFIQDDYLRAKANPKIVHFAGRFTPCYKTETDCCDIFWDCAKNSYFYEKIISIMTKEVVKVEGLKKKKVNILFYLPYKTFRFLKCFKENGFRYTIKRIVFGGDKAK